MRQGAEIGGASLMSDPRDINRDAKWRLLVMNERLSPDPPMVEVS